MRMKLLLPLSAVMAAFLFCSCGKKTGGNGEGEVYSFELFPSSVSVGPGENMRRITVTSSVPWSVSVDKLWCRMEPVNGRDGETVVTLTIDANEDAPDGRSAIFTFCYGELTKSYTVSQAAPLDRSVQADLAPGERLSENLTGKNPQGITSLKITGEMAAEDFSYIRDNMPGLAGLDLADATVDMNEIPDHAFMNDQTHESHTGIETFIFPKRITSIGRYAFAGCLGLSGQLDIPEGVTSIKACAFAGCYGLNDRLTLPSTLETIGVGAFDRCSNLNGDLVIPENVTTIERDAFSECSGFKGGLFLPSSLKSIKGGVFLGCGFTSLTCLVPSPSDIFVGDMAFAGIAPGTPLYVPEESVADYAATLPWSDYDVCAVE